MATQKTISIVQILFTLLYLLMQVLIY